MKILLKIMMLSALLGLLTVSCTDELEIDSTVSTDPPNQDSDPESEPND